MRRAKCAPCRRSHEAKKWRARLTLRHNGRRLQRNGKVLACRPRRSISAATANGSPKRSPVAPTRIDTPPCHYPSHLPVGEGHVAHNHPDSPDVEPSSNAATNRPGGQIAAQRRLTPRVAAPRSPKSPQIRSNLVAPEIRQLHPCLNLGRGSWQASPDPGGRPGRFWGSQSRKGLP